MKRIPLIISTDPGIDDAAALTISLFAQELDVRMIVATWGNVSLKHTLDNALRLETFLKTTVPVVKGSAAPLIRDAISAADVHGVSGMVGYQFPEADLSLLKRGNAIELMHQEINKQKEKVTLVALGPLTDFALLFKQYPEDISKIDKLFIMGCNIGRGNYTPLAEYNIACDPEAAAIVFHTGLKIVVAPLEIGRQAAILPDDMSSIKAHGRVGEMLYGILTGINEESVSGGVEIYDATAIGMLLHPQMYTFRRAHVEIEVTGKYTYGASVIDFSDKACTKYNAEIAVAVDHKIFTDWFLKVTQSAEMEKK